MKVVFLTLGLLIPLSIVVAQPGASRLPEGATVHRDLAYVSGGHARQKLDLYLPKDGENLPLIINIHGGAFRMGSKENGVPLEYLARGYAVASINYRLSQHAVFPAQIEDCKAAVRWLRAHASEYRLDLDRFAVWGSSAGGHLAAMLGTTGDTREFDVGENLATMAQGKTQSLAPSQPTSPASSEDAWHPASSVPGETKVHRETRMAWWREARFGMFIHFNPIHFDALEWVDTARAAGMKYIVLTAKHCDGFLLWHSQADGYNIANTPFQRDICQELAKAAHDEGMRLGWYFSPMDWRDRDFRTERNAAFIDRIWSARGRETLFMSMS